MKVIYTKKRLCVFRSVLCFLVFLIGFFPPISVFAQDTLQVTSSQGILYEKTEKPLPSYAALMREFRAVQLNKNFNGKSFDSNEQAIRKSALLKNLERFLKKEREADNLLTVFDEKKQTLYSQIEAQIHELGGSTGFMDTVEMFVKEIFGVKTSDFSSIDETTSRDVSVPENPGTFTSSNENPVIQDIDNARATLSPGQEIPSGLQKLITIEEVFAAELPLPVLDDVKGDEAEAFISEEIKSLARDLDNNPVKINNYLTKTLQYEPYWGAKKGSVGCLREHFCNDVDATSLAISLYRAAGIPAHYKKGFVLVSAERFKNLLGVNDVKATFLALSLAKVPVYVLSDALNGKFLSDADFSNEKFFAMEWTHPEIFIEYDERAGNTFNTLSFEDATSTEGLREALLAYPKKEWIPTDVIFGLLKRSQSDDVLGSISFDARAFFSQYLKGTSGTSPLNALDTAVSQIANNRHILTDQSARTTFTREDHQLSVLPPALPYIHVQGVVNGNPAPAAEIWSKLPDAKRTTVTISLLRASDISTVLEKTFFGSEINNQETILSYVGATDADKQTIDEYGGIAQTPAALVDIMPALDVDMIHADGSRNVKIGETLILKFSYIRNGTVAYTDEKFSVAGNQEGIYIALSHINHDASLDTNQHILLRGNVGIARTYLEDVTNDVQTLSEVLGHPLIVEFTRAVVTENRILTEINSLPTTFDFKGLSIDASAYINDYSARDGYLAHRKDFHLLYGLIGSYYEQATLTRVTGLSSISTVSGLQYAYANPSVYTVSEITKANESVIDSLNLSDNTKANMHADVGKGNTVITPNILVQKGNWKGILYISLKSDFTGQYAIGEQTAGNGGWTVDSFTLENELDDNGNIIDGHVYATVMSTDGVPERFTFGDIENGRVHAASIDNSKASIKSTAGITEIDASMCRTQDAWREQIKRSAGWKSQYGYPCIEETRRFGSVSHKFILTKKAAKFTSAEKKYDYWVSSETVKNVLSQKDSGERIVRYGFNFSTGTYLAYGSKNSVLFYQPVQPLFAESGRAWNIKPSFFSKLQERSYKPEYFYCALKDKLCAIEANSMGNVLSKVGYPIEDESQAATSDPFGTDGWYQTFVGGQLYRESTWNSRVGYIQGYIAEEFNKNENCQKYCGTGGILGFPTSDPVYTIEKNMVFQDFENGTRVYAFYKGVTDEEIDRIEAKENIQLIPMVRNYSDEKYRDDLIEGMIDSFTEYGIYGVAVNFASGMAVPVVFNSLKGHLINELGKKGLEKVTLRFMPYVGWAYAGVTTKLAFDETWPVVRACNTDPDATPYIGFENGAPGKSPAYYCGKLLINGVALGIGALTTTGVSKVINKLGTGTPFARSGKAKTFAAIENDGQHLSLMSETIYSKRTRTAFYELIEKMGLSTDEIRLILRNPQTMKTFFSEDFFQMTRKINATSDDIKGVILNEQKLARALSTPFGFKRVILSSDLEPRLPSGYKDTWSGIHDKISVALKDKTFSSYGELKIAYWKAFAKLPEAQKFEFTKNEFGAIENGTSPMILINGKKVQIQLHHLLPQKVSKEDLVNLENIFPTPSTVHSWTHSTSGSTYKRFGPLQKYQEPDRNSY